jgi:hypothetical protein
MFFWNIAALSYGVSKNENGLAANFVNKQKCLSQEATHLGTYKKIELQGRTFLHQNTENVVSHIPVEKIVFSPSCQRSCQIYTEEQLGVLF